MKAGSQKALIGAFVIGAVTLVVVGVIALGSGRLFSKTQTYVHYFDESVKGLSVGAPVLFRGVKVGSVVVIRLEGDFDQLKFAIPVITEIDTDAFPFGIQDGRGAEAHQALIEKGLCAQLQLQSFVTGQLMINLDFHPGRPMRMTPDSKRYLQIPTITSASQELTQRLDGLPLKELLDRANSAFDGLDHFLRDPALQRLPTVVTGLVAEARGLVGNVDQEVVRVSADLRQTLASASAALTAAERALAFEEGPPAVFVRSATEAFGEAQRAFATLDKALQTADGLLQDDRPVVELREALRELGLAAQAIRTLADTLERRPEMLLRGKKVAEEERE